MTPRRLAPLVAALVLAPALATLAAPALAGAPAGAAATLPGDANGDSFVVIAIVDTGINPYHRAFRAAYYPRNVDADPANDVDFSAHPSTYLSGFPAGATALSLSLGAPNYNAARTADLPVFETVQNNRLYWIPGTKIVGAYDSGSSFLLEPDDIHILDEGGHGTATASLATSNSPTYAPTVQCTECLVVAVEGSSGFEWAVSQPWIDIVSNSWGARANIGFPMLGLLGSANSPGRSAAERGQTVLFASGNGAEGGFVVPVATYTSDTVGPSWFVRVGAHVECGGEEAVAFCESPVVAAGKPADLTAPGQGWVPAAAHDHFNGLTEFSGTSASTPIAAGYMGQILLTLRKAMGDAAEGQLRGGQVVAQGRALTGTPHATPASDGTVTRQELWDLAFGAASSPVNGTGPYNYAPAATPGSYVWYGWGLVNQAAKARAAAAALGQTSLPDKTDSLLLALADKTAQERLWGQWDRNGDGVRDSYQLEFVAAAQKAAKLP